MPRPLSMDAEELKKYILANVGIKIPYEMHKETDVAEATIQKYAWKMGLSIELESKKEKRERIIKAISEHHELHTVKEIAAMMNVSPAAIAYRGWIMGVKFKLESERRIIVPKPISSIAIFNPKALCRRSPLLRKIGACY